MIKPGDLIGFTGRGVVSAGINLGTFASPCTGLSHIGIVAQHGGKPDMYLYESTTFRRSACVRRGRIVRGVQCHNLLNTIDGNKSSDEYLAIWHIPLRRPLYYHEESRLVRWLDRQTGKPYDMLGAGRSSGFLHAMAHRILETEDLNSLFCSEYVAGALAHIGLFQTRSASQWSPNRLYRRLLRLGVVDRKRRMNA